MCRAVSIVSALASAIALAFLPADAYAQMDERKPGIYTVVGGESKALPYVYGQEIGMGASSGGLGVSVSRFMYNGVTSGVNASDTFVLVINSKQAMGAITPWKFNNLIQK